MLFRSTVLIALYERLPKEKDTVGIICLKCNDRFCTRVSDNSFIRLSVCVSSVVASNTASSTVTKKHAKDNHLNCGFVLRMCRNLCTNSLT